MGRVDNREVRGLAVCVCVCIYIRVCVCVCHFCITVNCKVVMGVVR